MKPVFRHRLVPVEINIGNIAKFECEIEDAPNVNFKWFKDGHPIKEGEKYRIISRLSISSLELLSPNKDDSGEYSCKASNKHGSDECSATLSVTGKSKACFLPLRWLSLELLLFPFSYKVSPFAVLCWLSFEKRWCFRLNCELFVKISRSAGLFLSIWQVLVNRV